MRSEQKLKVSISFNIFYEMYSHSIPWSISSITIWSINVFAICNSLCLFLLISFIWLDSMHTYVKEKIWRVIVGSCGIKREFIQRIKKFFYSYEIIIVSKYTELSKKNIQQEKEFIKLWMTHAQNLNDQSLIKIDWFQTCVSNRFQYVCDKGT